MTSLTDHIRRCNTYRPAEFVPLLLGEERIGRVRRRDNAAACVANSTWPESRSSTTTDGALTLGGAISAVRAGRKVNLPVVLSRPEVAKVISLVEGVAQLVVQLLYGSGLRIMESVRLRIKDVDLEMKQVTVRSGKGEKDRFTTLAEKRR